MYLVDINICEGNEATQSRIQHQINYDTDEGGSVFDHHSPSERSKPGIPNNTD
jgi:hypothetical protein